MMDDLTEEKCQQMKIKNEAYIEARRQEDLTSGFFWACSDENLDHVKEYVEKGVNIDGLYSGYSRYSCSGSPFGYACARGNKQIVEFLIEKDVDIAKPDQYGRTSLMMASHNNRTEIVELLLIHNSSPEFVRYQDSYQYTALMMAAVFGHEDTVRLLLLYDPSEEHIAMKNGRGETVIDLAFTKKIRQLLESPTIKTKRAKPSGG